MSVASVAALIESTRDVRAEMLYWVAIEAHGPLSVGRTFGTLREGSEFEILYALLALFDGDRLLALDLYEPEDLDVARARLEARRRKSVPAA